MSDYVKATNFYVKDSLLVGNPDKIVKGSELDTEFNNIATAIASKANYASPNLTGLPTAPTAANGTNTSQLATTAFVKNAVDANSASVAITGGTMDNVDITHGTVKNLDEPLLVNSGGTGKATLALNNVLLGNGTDPVKEVAPGASGNVLTSDGTEWKSSAAAVSGLGEGQSWQNLTGSRALATSYQNTTGRSIAVVVSFTANAPRGALAGDVSTDNSTWVRVNYTWADRDDDINGGSLFMIVPPNHYYKYYLTTGSVSVDAWAELRT